MSLSVADRKATSDELQEYMEIIYGLRNADLTRPRYVGRGGL